MKYYLARQEPPSYNGLIILTHQEVHAWDVSWILTCEPFKITSELLYDLWHDDKNSTIYLENTDQHTFDLMDSLSIPHFNPERIAVIVDQEIYHHDTMVRRAVRWYDDDAHPTLSIVKNNGHLQGTLSYHLTTCHRK